MKHINVEHKAKMKLALIWYTDPSSVCKHRSGSWTRRFFAWMPRLFTCLCVCEGGWASSVVSHTQAWCGWMGGTDISIAAKMISLAQTQWFWCVRCHASESHLGLISTALSVFSLSTFTIICALSKVCRASCFGGVPETICYFDDGKSEHCAWRMVQKGWS